MNMVSVSDLVTHVLNHLWTQPTIRGLAQHQRDYFQISIAVVFCIRYRTSGYLSELQQIR